MYNDLKKKSTITLQQLTFHEISYYIPDASTFYMRFKHNMQHVLIC